MNSQVCPPSFERYQLMTTGSQPSPPPPAPSPFPPLPLLGSGAHFPEFAEEAVRILYFHADSWAVVAESVAPFVQSTLMLPVV